MDTAIGQVAELVAGWVAEQVLEVCVWLVGSGTVESAELVAKPEPVHLVSSDGFGTHPKCHPVWSAEKTAWEGQGSDSSSLFDQRCSRSSVGSFHSGR